NLRVKQTEDVVKMGDEIWVKWLGVDEKGRVRLSRKADMAERDQQMGGGGAEGGGNANPEERSGEAGQGEHHQDREHRGDRGEPRGGDRGDRGPRRSPGDRGGDRGGNRAGGDRPERSGDRTERPRES